MLGRFRRKPFVFHIHGSVVDFSAIVYTGDYTSDSQVAALSAVLPAVVQDAQAQPERERSLPLRVLTLIPSVLCQAYLADRQYVVEVRHGIDPREFMREATDHELTTLQSNIRSRWAACPHCRAVRQLAPAWRPSGPPPPPPNRKAKIC